MRLFSNHLTLLPNIGKQDFKKKIENAFWKTTRFLKSIIAETNKEFQSINKQRASR